MQVKVKDIVKMAKALIAIIDFEGTTYDEDEAIEIAEKILKETNNEYERGWQDALNCAIEASNRDVDGYLARRQYVSDDTLNHLKLAHNEASVNLEREVEI